MERVCQLALGVTQSKRIQEAKYLLNAQKTVSAIRAGIAAKQVANKIKID